ncbi:MAG TPA: B12-binding domain-containing protein [Pyrinomonadaceae bacterium]|nr:B12-binding domain-containing protein [Pyrinomonadaceae bacterium]
MLELNGLTTKEVARLCRVSDATVKRWEEAGLLKSERTSGGHRRFRAEEVARFQRRQNVGAEMAARRGGESARAALRRRRIKKSYSGSLLLHSLLAGREDEAANILIGAYLRRNSLAQIFDDSVCPAMRRVGELWFDGEINVAQEHLATRAAYNAIYRLRESVAPVVPEINERLAFCCTIEGDFHELPAHLAQMTLEAEGWETMNFGANTPLYSLTDEVLYHSPEVICISAAMIADYERLARDYKEFRARIAKLKTPVVLGGKAFADKRVRARFPAELYAANFTELAGFVKGLAAK